MLIECHLLKEGVDGEDYRLRSELVYYQDRLWRMLHRCLSVFLGCKLLNARENGIPTDVGGTAEHDGLEDKARW